MEQWQTENRASSLSRLQSEGAGSDEREGLIWNPVKMSGRSGMFESGKSQGLPQKTILRGPSKECGFCSGTGTRKGSVCPACRGKGEIYIRTGTAVVCGFCRGTGEDKPRSNVTCLVCKGAGVVAVDEPIATCPQCRGRGRESGNANLPCAKCRGKGIVHIKAGETGFLGRPSGSAGQVADVIHDMGAAGKTQIAKRVGLSTDYIAFVCESMIKKGTLEKAGRGVYRLTLECKALLDKDEAVQLEKVTSQQLNLLRFIKQGEKTVADLSASAHIPVDQVQKITGDMAKKDFIDVLLNGRILLARKGKKALEKDGESVGSGQ
jgi:predicted transcriptional regulator